MPHDRCREGTVVRLLVALGQAARDYQDAVLRDLPCRDAPSGRNWSYVVVKERTVTAAGQSLPLGAGDAWTWVTIDRDTKLVPWGQPLWGSAYVRPLRSWYIQMVLRSSPGFSGFCSTSPKSQDLYKVTASSVRSASTVTNRQPTPSESFSAWPTA